MSQNFKEELNQITILTGANATGKSSVIQAILLAVNSYRNIEKRKSVQQIFLMLI